MLATEAISTAGERVLFGAAVASSPCCGEMPVFLDEVLKPCGGVKEGNATCAQYVVSKLDKKGLRVRRNRCAG